MALFAAADVLDDREPHGGALNMAIDEALLRSGIKRPILRIYRWAVPSVSFGYFVKFADVLKSSPGLRPVRRWTGGGIVPHGEDFTYSLVVPADDPFMSVPPAESYLTIHRGIARALREIGASASVAESPSPKISDACFENAVRHDLVEGAKKIAGAAQRRTRHGLLHQGSIQFADASGRLADAVVAELVGDSWPRSPSTGELDAARTLADAKYGTDEWLYRC